MRRNKWLLTVSSTVFGGLIVLAFLIIVPQRGLASDLQAPPGPNLEVSAGYNLDVDPDTVVEYVHTITNTGDVSALFGVQAEASEAWQVDYANEQYPGGTTILMPFPLQAGEATTMGVRLTVPDDVVGGTVNTTTVMVTLILNGSPYTSTFVYDIATVNMRYVYLPMVLRNYDPFDNGDFSDGLESWDTSGILGVSVALDPNDAGNAVTLLGNPAYACNGGIPLGLSGISQSFSVPHAPSGKSVHLQFRYRIYTNDRNDGLTDVFDSFDVLVNGELKFRDANQTDFDYCNVDPYDLGWRVGDIDLGAGGENVTLSFEVHNRADSWYNTYVYVDDVKMVFVD